MRVLGDVDRSMLSDEYPGLSHVSRSSSGSIYCCRSISVLCPFWRRKAQAFCATTGPFQAQDINGNLEKRDLTVPLWVLMCLYVPLLGKQGRGRDGTRMKDFDMFLLGIDRDFQWKRMMTC